jgi:hypothetical protein
MKVKARATYYAQDGRTRQTAMLVTFLMAAGHAQYTDSQLTGLHVIFREAHHYQVTTICL